MTILFDHEDGAGPTPYGKVESSLVNYSLAR